MRTIQTLLSARHVVPVDTEDSILENHSIAIDNGRIADILPTQKALENFSANSHIEYDNHILMPGLVNAHTHAAMSLLRGIASDISLMEWLQNHIWPIEQKWADESFVHDGSELAIAEMLRSGTTCFNDMYFFPHVTARVASTIGIRAVIGMIALEFPTAYAASPDEYISKGLSLYDDYKADPLITNVFAPHAPYTVSDATLTKINSYANELDLPIHMHIHETKSEIETSIKEFGMRPLARLDKLGLVNPNLLAVHMTQLDEQEIQQVSDAGVTIIHCPESNMKLASGFCPTHKLLTNNARVIIGTDSCASNDDLDMFSEIRSAALIAKGFSEEATAFSSKQAIRAATIDAAKALGLEDEIGSIEKGKAADIIAISCEHVEAHPLFDVHSHLAYSTNGGRVSDVFVSGRQLLRDRTLTTVSEDDIIAKTEQWVQKISHT
ncbi:MAG: TRZ/ATZ family hydrolase [Gammaproteobacteria bacterium]|nr:TRZ/ATZ family hydrolase [Gammaproteobacteria bacterium]